MLLYAVVIFLSAFLLFQVQPVIARMILPWFGGSAAVWSTCMLFFQVVLLAGYCYSHFLFERLRPRRQSLLHIALLILSLAALPILPNAAWKPTGGENPSLQILGLLAATIGLPYFLLSTTGPLLQAWYSREHNGALPYRLFALSNFASMLALISYPVLVEPNLTSKTQAYGWSAGFAVFVAGCAVVAWRGRGSESAPAVAEEGIFAAPSLKLRLLWMALAAAPSILLLAVTTHLTQDVAAIPFLWILPLVLYLLTFILCFEARDLYWRRVYWTLFIIALGGIGWLQAESSPELTMPQSIAAYAAALFVCTMVCHGELAGLKPAPRYLTSFYVSLSLGGAMGGIFVGLVAPYAFNADYEFPLSWWLAALVATLALLYRNDAIFRARAGVATFIVLIAALSGYAGWWVQVEKRHIGGYRLVQRNFYGMLRVEQEGNAINKSLVRSLVHGVIYHGRQYLDPSRRRQPTTYYCRESGVGQAILDRREGVPQHLGVIGLGTGTLAVYGRYGDELDIYEINPAVLRLAQSEFTFLADSKPARRVHLGDARLTLERQPPMHFDVLAVDAFSGDAVPVHLLTREAFQLYFQHVKSDGVLAVHISNKYLTLEPVVAADAAALGMMAVDVSDDREDSDEVCYSSTWILVLSPGSQRAHPALTRSGKIMRPTPGFRTWTDDFSNLFRCRSQIESS